MGVDTIEKLIGVPYKHGGRDPQQGFDCWTLCEYVYGRFWGIAIDVNVPPTTYTTSVKKHKAILDYRDTQKDAWEAVSSPKQKDLVFMSSHPSKRIHHCGVMINNFQCLHAFNQPRLGIGHVVAHQMVTLRKAFNYFEFWRRKDG